MASSFIGSQITRSATESFRAHGPINLTDNTSPVESAGPQDAAENDDTEGLSATRRTYSHKLREELANRKFRKYQESSYAERTAGSRPGLSHTSTQRSRLSASGSKLGNVREGVAGFDGPSTPSDTPTPTTPLTPGISSVPSQKPGRLRRGGRKVRQYLHRRRYKEVQEGDSEIDILYENQRGAFLFGVPHFSSRTLLNFDPKPWLNADMRPSPVTVSTAQCPDPSWQWDWKTWYVDMSDDVDEEGWQYSFMFQNKFVWHGSHPWFHSFVRRRRWIRKRVRKHAVAALSKKDAADPMKVGHQLNADYFTIHPARPKSIADSTARSSGVYYIAAQDDDIDDDDEDLDDLGTLLRRLKLAKVDREKINLVLKYMDKGDQDTYYLAEEMHHIFSLFVYQSSRKRLLALMNEKIDAAAAHREEHIKRDQPEFENEKRKIDNLVKAREAADSELRALEYWSDIKDNVGKGKSADAVALEKGWDHGWEGLDSSGPGKAGRPEDDTDEVFAHGRLQTDTDKSTAPSLADAIKK